MARKRMIDPEFWVDDDMSLCDMPTRLFYIGTWNFSDDYGVVENSPAKLKVQIFPYDTIEVTPLIDQLVQLKKLIPFEMDGKNWLFIRNFLKWQRVDKPSTKRNPAPPVDIIGDSSATPLIGVRAQVKRSKVKLSKVKLSKVNTVSQAKPRMKILTSVQELVEYFFQLKGWVDKSRPIFSRFVRPAKDLLELCDDSIVGAKEKLDLTKRWADSAQLDWSIETVFKKWNDLAYLPEAIEKNKKAYIGSDRAYQKDDDWYVILPNGEHKKWIGPLNEIHYE